MDKKELKKYASLSKKNVKDVEKAWDKAEKEASFMGKEKDDKFVKQIFLDLLDLDEERIMKTLAIKFCESDLPFDKFIEALESQDIPQDVRPEQQNKDEDDVLENVDEGCAKKKEEDLLLKKDDEEEETPEEEEMEESKRPIYKRKFSEARKVDLMYIYNTLLKLWNDQIDINDAIDSISIDLEIRNNKKAQEKLLDHIEDSIDYVRNKRDVKELANEILDMNFV